LPDIVVAWDDKAPFQSVTSPRIGLVEGTNLDPRPGTHSASGFVLAAGPGVWRDRESRGHLMDIAPSVLHLLGVPPTQGLDGTLLEALTAGWTAPDSVLSAPTEAR